MRTIKFNRRLNTKGIVLVLGNFDGVHIGHQKLIKEAVKYSHKRKLSCYAMTFDPHPQEVVNPGRGLSLLTTLSERLDLLKMYGLDGVVVKKFTKLISRLSPEKFIKDLLVDHLRIKKVFVGFDFAFGRNRSGSISLLKKLGKKYDFEVHDVSPVKTQGHLVKSSTIREMLTTGNFSTAFKLLGHPFTLTGRVVKGRGRGRGLGFPTANLSIAADKLIPAHGVYAGRYGKYKCAVNIGSRPTFAEERFAVEVYIIGYRGDLKGKTISVDVFRRLRPEIHFSDVERLKEQIALDIKKIRKMY